MSEIQSGERKKFPSLECMQEPGDLIYVPEAWYHAVVNIGEVLSIAILSANQ